MARTPKTTHGGKRDGAGRKRAYPGGTEIICLTIPVGLKPKLRTKARKAGLSVSRYVTQVLTGKTPSN